MFPGVPRLVLQGPVYRARHYAPRVLPVWRLGGLEIVMWIVIDIGCLECWIDSHVVGVFTDESRANSIAKRLNRKWGTDQQCEVFGMPEVDVLPPEYNKW